MDFPLPGFKSVDIQPCLLKSKLVLKALQSPPLGREGGRVQRRNVHVDILLWSPFPTHQVAECWKVFIAFRSTGAPSRRMMALNDARSF